MITCIEFEKSLRSLKKGTGFWKNFTKKQRNEILKKWKNYKQMYDL